MAGKHSLLLALTVNRLSPAPQTASVGIGFFRVPCPLVDGNVVSDQTFTVGIGQTVTRGQPCSTLVLRTDRPVTVVTVAGDVTNTLVVSQLLVLTSPLDSIAITYPEDSVPLTVAQVSLIQS